MGGDGVRVGDGDATAGSAALTWTALKPSSQPA
jgi:hypothetical protein